jgi:hypothetical protein
MSMRDGVTGLTLSFSLAAATREPSYRLDYSPTDRLHRFRSPGVKLSIHLLSPVSLKLPDSFACRFRLSRALLASPAHISQSSKAASRLVSDSSACATHSETVMTRADLAQVGSFALCGVRRVIGTATWKRRVHRQSSGGDSFRSDEGVSHSSSQGNSRRAEN